MMWRIAAVLLLCSLTFALALRSIDTSPKITEHEVEAHHSIAPPLDKSQVYWNFGGSTVMTRNFIRLTPSTQDRKGWLWNEYPIESENWQVEFSMKVFSKPHYGGDGMAFWILGGEYDPAFNRDSSFLTGPIFGMKNDFKGIGLIFDVYDNDNRRNNPSVFVIENDGKSRQYDHDHDYENDIIKTMPEDHTLSGLTHGKYQSYKCVADFRNAHSNTKVLVKFLHKALHVYLDTESSGNYKFCLAVQFDRDFRDYHMAFTAATGQVADNHDVEFIETSYLADSDLEFDDSLLEHFASNASGSLVNTVSDLLVFILSFALTGFAGWQLFGFKKMMAERLDEVRVCHTLNKHVSNHFMAHFAFCLLLLFNGMYLLLLLHVPLAGMRVYLLSKKKHIFTASAISGQAHKDHPLGAFAKIYSTSTRLISSLVLYGVTLLYILFMLI